MCLFPWTLPQLEKDRQGGVSEIEKKRPIDAEQSEKSGRTPAVHWTFFFYLLATSRLSSKTLLSTWPVWHAASSPDLPVWRQSDFKPTLLITPSEFFPSLALEALQPTDVDGLRLRRSST